MGAVLVRGIGRLVTLARPSDDLHLVDLLDRLLAGGVVLAGDITISLAGVDLVQISLRALISSVSTLAAR
jgi:gas vesicle protein GvpA/GvpJ/GvpM family